VRSRAALASLVGFAALASLAGAARAAAPAAAAPLKRFAIVVGNNASPRAGLATLRYADDDAVRWTLLLRTFGTQVELLTELDAESERLYGPAAPARTAPSVAAIDAAMERLGRRVREARAAGERTAFFFVYAGHGDVEGSEGYVALGKTRFSRSDLESHVLAASPADTNHVIVDACRSFYLAAGRGPGGTRRPWTRPYFDASAAARFPNTGFLLSTSSGGSSHEWEEFQAGIFSHEVRSGLLGGADADGDGRVTYRELAAFVHVANQAVRNEQYRPDILAQPPRDGDSVLLATTDARAGRLRVGPGHASRYVLEDGLGIRWADLHPASTQDLAVALPAAWGDGQALFLRTPADEREYRLERGGDVTLPSIAAQPLSVVRRGAVHEAFALLFSVPFDAAAVGAEPPLVLREAPPARRSLRPLAFGLGAAGVVAGAAAGVFSWRTSNLRSQHLGGSGDDRAALNADIESGNRWALSSAVAAGALLGTALVLYLWDRHERAEE
jgi:hypothetical protein